MKTIILKPENESELQLITSLMERMRIPMEVIEEEGTPAVEAGDFIEAYKENVEEARLNIPYMKNLQQARAMLYELMRAGYARLQKI